MDDLVAEITSYYKKLLKIKTTVLKFTIKLYL